MPSNFSFNEKNNKFEATYEHPWGGIATDAFKTDIAPNQFETSQNINISDGLLCAYVYDTAPLIQNALVNDTIKLMFSISQGLYSISALGNIYHYVNGTGFVLDQTNAACIDANCVQVIGGIAYVFSYAAGSSFVYTPGVSFVLGSAYVGGLYCAVLDQYLLTANTNQPTDSPPLKVNRINWSSPDGFTTWDPSVDRTSGYDVLADVQDYISAVFAMGNVGYVLRGQGMTQMTPTGVGIQPFDFTPLWSSLYGVGCTYPGSFAQYGYTAFWVTDIDVFVFSGSAPQAISGIARKAIYEDLNQVLTNSSEGVSPIYVSGVVYGQVATPDAGAVSSTPELEYAFYILTLTTSGPNTIFNYVIWTYKILTKQWIRTTVSKAVNTGGGFLSSFQTVYIPFMNALGAYFYKACPVLVLSISAGGNATNYIYSNYRSDINLPIASPSGAPPFSITFRSEQIKIGRKPNVRGVLIIATGKSTPQTIFVTVSNDTGIANFTAITVTGTVPKTYISNGMFTDQNPKCTLSSSAFDGTIVKVVMYGTYAEGELP